MVEFKRIIEGVLEKDPNCTDAILIKAQALIALGNLSQAKRTLQKVLDLSERSDPNRKWASTLLHELTQ